MDIICGNIPLWLDPLDLTFDHHNPRSLQDAPCRSLSNIHLVVYKVAGKGSVRDASCTAIFAYHRVRFAHRKKALFPAPEKGAIHTQISPIAINIQILLPAHFYFNHNSFSLICAGLSLGMSLPAFLS